MPLVFNIQLVNQQASAHCSIYVTNTVVSIRNELPHSVISEMSKNAFKASLTHKRCYKQYFIQLKLVSNKKPVKKFIPFNELTFLKPFNK
ncbi:hypothetical protein BpHYR1_040605, partial [Brachionus plicatilis]